MKSMNLQDLNKIVLLNLEKMKKEIGDNIRSCGQRASGKTIASLDVKQTDDNTFELWGNEAVEALEHGRKGGKVPKTFQNIIRQWILDKRISVKPIGGTKGKISPQERGLQTMSYLIARKIKQSGTKLYRSGKHNDIYNAPIKEASERIEDNLFKVLELEILNTIK